MHEKIAAYLILSLALAWVIAPVEGHFTLGLQCGSSPTPSCLTPSGGRFRLNDYERGGIDDHKAGPVGWIWPGAGYNSWIGNPSNTAGLNAGPPGYISPFPGSPPGIPLNWLQAQGNAYAPSGAILTSTEAFMNRGDLIFAVSFKFDSSLLTAQNVVGSDFIYDGLAVYLPPEFGLEQHFAAPLPGLITSTITNNYDLMTLHRTTKWDAWGPAGPKDASGGGPWTVLQIEGPFSFRLQNQYGEWYYVRVNGVTAPKIAGRYFFKIFMLTRSGLNLVFSNDANNPIAAGPFRDLAMPPQNWPVLLVKGEVDPGILSGTIRYGTFNSNLHGLGVQLAGRVRMVGTAIDPYTGSLTGRIVEARGYFNASAAGHYEVEGVAPGVYDVYASAAGHPEQKISTGLKVLIGQSLQLDGFLQPGATVSGFVFSKHQFGSEPWPKSTRPIFIEVYRSREGASNMRDDDVVAFSPLNLTHSPFMAYDWPWGSAAPVPRRVAFPWEGPAGSLPPGHAVSTILGTLSKSSFGVHNGVGRDQFWWVDGNGLFTNGGGAASFRFFFGEKGFYGAPTSISGHVPQVLATWTSGLEPGRYWMRAWINGYVQKESDGIRDFEATFTITSAEFPGDASVPLDLRVSSGINKTILLHNVPRTAKTDHVKQTPIRPNDLSAGTGSDNVPRTDGTGSRFLIAEAYDSANRLVAFNFTLVQDSQDRAKIILNGFGMAGPDTKFWGPGMKFSLLAYRGIRDYGIPAGTYTIRVYMRGYGQDVFESFSIGLSGSMGSISNHLYRSAILNITAFSSDFQAPRINREWAWPGAPMRVYVEDEAGTTMGFLDRPNVRGDTVRQPLGSTSFLWINWDGPYSGVDESGPDGARGTFLVPIWRMLTPDDSLSTTRITANGFLARSERYRKPDLASKTGLPPGTYQLRGRTYGYIQRQDFPIFTALGSASAVNIILTIGAEVEVTVKLKKENLFDRVPFHSAMRVRVFDDSGRLIAHASIGLFDSIASGLAVGLAGRSGYYVEDPAGSSRHTFRWSQGGALRSANDPGFGLWIPGKTDEIQIRIAGIYDRYDPVFGLNRWYGLPGAPDYGGEYTMEVDLVNWYHPSAPENPSALYPAGSIYYPPARGLLLGESWHTVPGSSVGPYGITGARGPYAAGNHLGPLGQRIVWKISNARISGAASAVFELDLRGFIRGQVLGFTWTTEFRPLSFITINEVGEGLRETSWTWDGLFETYLPAGAYRLSVIEWSPRNEGHLTLFDHPVSVSSGQNQEGLNFNLEQSRIPIAEFPMPLTLASLTVTLVAIILLGRKSCTLVRKEVYHNIIADRSSVTDSCSRCCITGKPSRS